MSRSNQFNHARQSRGQIALRLVLLVVATWAGFACGFSLYRGWWLTAYLMAIAALGFWIAAAIFCFSFRPLRDDADEPGSDDVAAVGAEHAPHPALNFSREVE